MRAASIAHTVATLLEEQISLSIQAQLLRREPMNVDAISSHKDKIGRVRVYAVACDEHAIIDRIDHEFWMKPDPMRWHCQQCRVENKPEHRITFVTTPEGPEL